MPNGVIQVLVQGVSKVRLLDTVQEKPYIVARLEPIEESSGQSNEALAWARNLSHLFQKMIDLTPSLRGFQDNNDSMLSRSGFNVDKPLG